MDEKILLIEDNDDDVLMITRALKKGKIGNNFQRVANGKDAIEFFEKEESNKLQLLLLDLNMEIMNGFEFLKKRQEIPKIKKVPVVVLTSSHREKDIELAYELGANAYVEKPIEPKEFIDVILKIEDFWLYIAKKPEI